MQAKTGGNTGNKMDHNEPVGFLGTYCPKCGPIELGLQGSEKNGYFMGYACDCGPMSRETEIFMDKNIALKYGVFAKLKKK